MNKKLLFLAITVYILALTGICYASSTSVGVSAAFGERSSSAYTLSATQTYEPWVSGELGEIAPTAEIGASLWHVHDNNVFGGFLAPGMQLTLFTGDASLFQPYIGASVGGTAITDKDFDHWNLGSHVLFRTKGTVGVKFGDDMRHKVQGEYTHHSTWGISSNHDSFGTYGMSYNYSF